MMSITSNSLFVDTSGWVSLIGSDEAAHLAVAEVYQAALRQRRRMVTTNYIITEVVALLTGRHVISRERMIAFVDSLLVAPHLDIYFIDHAIHDEAWSLVKERPDKEWSLVDASSFVIMTRFGMTEALAADHHFAQAGFICLPLL